MPPPKCFVRVWHHSTTDDETNRPLLLVTYRLALEKVSCDWESEVVHYDAFSRERVSRVSMITNEMAEEEKRALHVVLKKEPLVDSERARHVVFFEAERLPKSGGLLVITIGLAYSLSPETDKIRVKFRGRLWPWVDEIQVLPPTSSSKWASTQRERDRELVVTFSQSALAYVRPADSDFESD